MPEPESRRLKAPGAAVAALVLAIFAAEVLAFRDMRQDDPFISFRYGQNLATGHGLTFNPGERFLGATSPLHMLLAGFVYLLAGREATPEWMSVLGCAAWSAQAIAVYAVLAPGTGALAAAVAALAIACGAARSFMWVPFETHFVAACSLFALALARRKAWYAAALLAAGACLFRPDAALLALPLAAWCVFDLRARALGPACVFGGLTGAWIGFASVYYGSPLPHSAVEKFQRSTFDAFFGHALLQLGETVWPFSRPALWAGALAALGATVGAVWIARLDRALGLLGLYAALHLGAYLVLRPFTGHDWHLYPVNLIATVSIYGGLATLACGARRTWLRFSTGGALAGLSLLALLRSADAARSYAHTHWTGDRDTAYRSVAAFMRERAQPHDEFASIEVGTLAYYSALPAYDLGGIVTDLRRTQMLDRPVRWLVLDQKYIAYAPPAEPVFIATEHGFKAYVFELPRTPARSRGP